MKKNLLSLVLAWIMLLTLFAGCGETPASDTSPAPEPSVTDAEPAPAPEPPQESPEPEISAEDSAEAPADTLDLRPPLTYPLGRRCDLYVSPCGAAVRPHVRPDEHEQLWRF